MRKIILIFLSMYSILNGTTPTIEIRMACLSDLPSIYKLDHLVTMEFFLPLYKKICTKCTTTTPAENLLEAELENDKTWFPESLKADSIFALHVAYDIPNKSVVGFIVSHLESLEELEIDLLMVHPSYRGQKIGRTLINRALDDHPELVRCRVFPFTHFNEATLKFYEAVGFKKIGTPKKTESCSFEVPFNSVYTHYQLDIPS